MNWFEIKNKIRKKLLSRNLVTPNRRLNELDNLENLFRNHFQDYLENPKEMFGKTNKESFKNIVSKHKSNGRLNGAEKSLINDIYKIINKVE